jgi:hypothetical protein
MIIATFGIPICVAISLYSWKGALSTVFPYANLRSHSELILPFFPLQSLAGFAMGMLIAVKGGTFGRNRVARLTWIPTVLWLALLMTAWRPSVLTEDRWTLFFLSRSRTGIRMQLLTTLPFLTSVAYSLGNCIGMRIAQSSGD